MIQLPSGLPCLRYWAIRTSRYLFRSSVSTDRAAPAWMASRNLCQCPAGLPYFPVVSARSIANSNSHSGAVHSALRQMRTVEVLGDLLLRHPAIAILGFPGVAGTFAHSDHPSLPQQPAAVTGIAEHFAAVLCAGPVEVFHNRGELRLQAEEVAQLLGSRLEQGGFAGAGDLTEVLVFDHEAPGELDDGRAARQGDLQAHRRQEHAVLGREHDRTCGRERDVGAFCAILSLVLVIGVKS